MLKVEAVITNSAAFQAGIQKGDRLVSINGRMIVDILDYHLALKSEQLQIELLRGNQEQLECTLENSDQGDPGLQLEHPEPEHCGNNCLFCFVHQLPGGMRKSLYVKDEDYRFSYLYGAYVTLSNIDRAALRRIIDEQLSPLYVSVHATDDVVRAELLGRKAPPIVELLEELTGAGIEIHSQIVVCPGINDGKVLQRSIDALYRMAPGIRSLAIVPVGLTRYRNNLPALRTLTREEAKETLRQIEMCQRQFLRHGQSRFVFAADELYLQADHEFPDLSEYEDLWQLENGVGMVAHFRSEAAEVLREAEPLELQWVTTLTGFSFALELQRFTRQLAGATGVRIDVCPIRNRFFGEQVTVTGLLTGQDLIEQLSGKDLGDALLLPEVMLKDDQDLFLDDLSLSELAQQLQVPVIKIASSPWGLLDGLEELAYASTEVVRCDS